MVMDAMKYSCLNLRICAQWTSLPSSIHSTEDFCKWLTSEGKGLNVDMGGRVMQPRGGYDKETYHMVWHEKPHPHWYLNFLSGNTRVRNGGVCVAERIALICDGPSIGIQDMTIEGTHCSPLLICPTNLHVYKQ